MITTIKAFFIQFIEPASGQTQADSEHALRIATAAILVEMMRMDTRIADEERTAITSALQRLFGLDAAHSSIPWLSSPKRNPARPATTTNSPH